MGNPMQLLDEVRAFMKSRIILTGVELDLFTQVHRGTDTAQKLAENNRLDARAVTRLLDALVTYGILSKENGRYSLTQEGSFLSEDHPDTTLPMMRHMNELWGTWSHLTDAVRYGKNPERVPVPEKDEKTMKAFIGAMHVVARRLSAQIAEELDLSGYRKLLDIGGASGTYTIAFLLKNPEMQAVIFDLKKVLPMAEERLSEAGISDRVAFVSGDFYKDPLPEGCDLALLSAIIHQNSPQQNLALYKKIHQALLAGGTLMIRDHIMEEDRIYPPAGAIFAINMLVGTDGGDTYTFREVRESLEAAGFTDVHQIKKGERMDCLVTARKEKEEDA
jgi:predicted O-methyltransferase YrrM/predicted transcriptional regulator